MTRFQVQANVPCPTRSPNAFARPDRNRPDGQLSDKACMRSNRSTGPREDAMEWEWKVIWGHRARPWFRFGPIWAELGTLVSCACRLGTRSGVGVDQLGWGQVGGVKWGPLVKWGGDKVVLGPYDMFTYGRLVDPWSVCRPCRFAACRLDSLTGLSYPLPRPGRAKAPGWLPGDGHALRGSARRLKEDQGELRCTSH